MRPYLPIWENLYLKKKMQVTINDKPVQVEPGSDTLGALLRAEGFSGTGQAVAVNDRVVPKAQWDSTPLEEDMRIIVIRAVCGG